MPNVFFFFVVKENHGKTGVFYVYIIIIIAVNNLFL